VLSFISGLLTSLSLIVAIGAQNAFVIRQSLTKKHVLLVVLICSLSDAVLIAAGISGLGAIIGSIGWLLEIIRWFGVAYLTWFAVKSVRSAMNPQILDAGSAKSASRKQVVLSILGFTFLNPHVYLDTVIFLGSIANQFQAERWLFGAGAMLASGLWFFSIGFGARSAARFMRNPRFWQVLDFSIAVVMLTIAGLLVFRGL
jgi:L-lysine exporter family protein LysE/ArgO